MKKYFYTLIAIVILSFVFQACVPQQLEVNPGFGKKGSEISAAGAAPISQQTKAPPISKLAEDPEAQKPIWKIGYKWKYEWENPDTGSSGTVTRKIIREDIFDGIPSFVLKVGKYEDFWTKDVLGFLARKRKGKVITKRDAPFQALAWPLKVGRQWNNVFTREKPQEESSSNADFRFVVTKLEEVTVPAGKFKAFKIESYSSHTGNLLSEWWYSPKVNWFVKWIRYGSSPREERLKSYTTPESITTGPRQAPSIQVAKKVEQQSPAAKPVSKPILKAEKPEWKIGYWWEYRWKRPGRSGIYTEKVIREDTFNGVPSYVTKRGRREYFYTKDVLGEIGRMSRGRVDTKRTPPRQLLSWPLEVGKEWENPYLIERPTRETSNTVDKRLVVSKVEEVKVPAGTFKAFKIERYDSYSGELTAEWWYSPKVKWFVKRRLYRRDGLRERELLSFWGDPF